MVSSGSEPTTFEQVESALIQAQAKLNGLGKVHESFKEASSSIGEAAAALRELAGAAGEDRREYARILVELRAVLATMADNTRATHAMVGNEDVSRQVEALRGDVELISAQMIGVTGRLAAIELQTSRPPASPSVDLVPLQEELLMMRSALARLEARIDEHDDKAAAHAKRMTSHVTTKTEKMAAHVAERVEAVHGVLSDVQTDLRRGLDELVRPVDAAVMGSPEAPLSVNADRPAAQVSDVLPAPVSRFRRRK